MASAHPTISVITPNYNHGSFLPDLVAALSMQDPLPKELIFIDDASTDDSVRIIRKLQVQYPFIRLVEHPVNRGAIAAINTGIEAATGDLLVFRAADDLDLPGHFETAVNLLVANPDVDLFCGDLLFFTNKPEDGIVEPIGFSDTPKAFPVSRYPYKFGERWVNGHTIMVRREAMLRSYPFIEEIAFIADWFHFTAVGFRGGFCYAPRPVAAARVSHTSYSSQPNLDNTPAKAAIRSMLTALLGPYQDVCDAFLKSKCLLRFGQPLAEVVRDAPKLAPFSELADEIERIAKGTSDRESSFGLEKAIEASLRSRADAIADIGTHRSIWIYGAGGHTRALLAAWQTIGLPQVSGLLVSESPVNETAYQLPCYRFEEAPIAPGDLVILSSKSYEGYMAARVRERENTKCLAIWNRNFDSL